ncbi:MAG TPA: GTP cyclohydrolase I FolE [Planctomycetota bacterium]|nr:GTP cyclohydrolase I FolE [Planctomycetota bacterium]
MDLKKIEKGMRLILEGIGEDPRREGLRDTPGRVARMHAEIFSGIGQDASRLVQPLDSDKHDEIVLIRDIPFYGMCEHHFLPFIGKAHVAYLPKGSICGLSKLARVVDVVSRRPQLQERLTSEIADILMNTLHPRGVMVVVEAEHLCMTMRGVRKPGAVTTTSVVRGIFRNRAATRSEAMALIRGR